MSNDSGRFWIIDRHDFKWWLVLLGRGVVVYETEVSEALAKQLMESS